MAEEKKSRLEALREVAEDLNKKMKLEPKIDTDLDSAKELKNAILEEMEADGGQLYASDQKILKPETWEYLTETLGLEPKDDVGEEEPTEEKPKKSEKVKDEKAGKEKKGMAKKDKKDKETGKAPKKAKGKKAAEAEAGGGNDYPREQAICDVMRKKFQTTDEIAAAANEAHAKKGGKDNLDQTKRLVARYLKPFRYLGILEEKDGKFKVNV